MKATRAMFEEERLIGTPEADARIVVQTRAGNDLENFISPSPDYQQAQRYAGLRRRCGANWEPRKPATGGYNRAGMIWASRRTCLSNHKDWRTTLRDDGYRRTDEADLQVGDVVAYVRAEDVHHGKEPEILHVARICFFRHHQVAGRIAWAISKWDAQFGEDLHAVRDCAQLCGGEPYLIEFWTDRPVERRPISLV